MIEHEYKELYNQDSVGKQMVIAYDNGKITNKDLYSESFEMTESLCSESELRFGSCEASAIKFKITNTVDALMGKWLTVSQVLNDLHDTPFQFGKYKVNSDVPSGDRNYRNITAYDAMYDIINAEVVAWYDGLTFPITMRDFRNSFFEYLGIEQVETTLIQDDMLIDKTIDADSISGQTVITAICELNGVFGHINRQGLFSYISLDKRKQMLYPSMARAYPGSGIYPGMMLDVECPREDITKYISCEYEDFETQLISKVQVRQEENDIGAIYGTGTNTYIVQDNFLVYGKSSDELKTIASRLFSKINGVYYRPFKASLQGNPCIEVGDIVDIHTKYKDVQSHVLERTIKGIQALRDAFGSKGVYKYEENVNSVQKEIKRLKGKTNVLERTVEMLNSTITDEEKGLQTQVKQTAEEMTTKVSKGEVVSEINQSAEEVRIKGEKISLEGTVTANENFKVLEDGSVQAKNGNFEGTIKSTNAEITGGKVNIKTDSSDSSAIALWWNSYKSEMAPYSIMFSDSSNDSYLSSDSMWMAYLEELFLYIARSGVNIYTGLSVSGTKSRLAKTQSYNDILLYCYEMPSPIFGDVGHGVVGEDGLCYIDIDQVFFETVDLNQSYQVFLQSYSEHNVHVKEKQSQYFVVKGEPNTEFDWELKAKQLDFPIERLEEKRPDDDYRETDYVASAREYLSEYEQEVLSYE